MIKATRSLWVFALALVVFACQTQEAEQQAGIEEPAAVDTDAIRSSIEASDQSWEAAAGAGDATALAALYTEDAVLLPPGGDRMDGRPAIEAAFTDMLSGGAYEVALETQNVMISESGDLAVSIGRFEDAETTGKYLGVFENVDGEWLLVADIWNADGAAAPGE